MATVNVAIAGSECNSGDPRTPVNMTNYAAQVWRSRETVVVYEDVYKEWLQTPNAGLSKTRRISYQAAEGETVVVKGVERIIDWTRESADLWKAAILKHTFGAFNPYAEEIEGGWLVPSQYDAPRKHLGETYLNGKSIFEVHSRQEVENSEPGTEDCDRRTETGWGSRNDG